MIEAYSLLIIHSHLIPLHPKAQPLSVGLCIYQGDGKGCRVLNLCHSPKQVMSLFRTHNYELAPGNKGNYQIRVGEEWVTIKYNFCSSKAQTYFIKFVPN